MRHIPVLLLLALAAVARGDEPAFPKFKMQEIATDLTVGYAVITADVNEDGKPDIVVVDSKRVVWYENPTWKVHTIISGKTKPDNVCIAAADIDGDGQIDFVLGADWKPFNTKEGGTLQWLKRGKTLDEEWTVYPIARGADGPPRARWPTSTASGKPAIILAPLMGRDSSAKGNWMDGRPVRILAFPIPKDPVKGPWKPEVLSEELHVVHNILAGPDQATGAGMTILAASYEGVSLLAIAGGQVDHARESARATKRTRRAAAGPARSRWASSKERQPFIATIEPWHGNQVVVYTPPAKQDGSCGTGTSSTTTCAGATPSGVPTSTATVSDELVIGVRDNPAKGDTFTEKCGVRIYKATRRRRQEVGPEHRR